MHAPRIVACMEYDVAVLGLGGMGSAVAAHAAQRGLRVAGFERFAFAHDLGSSTGRSRIIRKAYFEDAAYVPLLDRAYTLWRDLEERSQTALLDLFGVLMVGRPDSATIEGTSSAAMLYDIPGEQLDAGQLRARFPRLAFAADEIGLYEPYAGVVFPERAVAAYLNAARNSGAHLYDCAPVRSYAAKGDGVEIRLAGGEIVNAARVAVCAGPWTSELLAHCDLPLRVQRNVQYWFTAQSGSGGPADIPAFFLEREGLPAPLYGIPDLGDGIKVAFHGYGELTPADQLDREVRADEAAAMSEALAALMPSETLSLRSSKVCMYTKTPDGNFAIGHDPCNPGVVIACGFSGHGFKFVPVIGEIVTRMLLGEDPQFDIAFLNLDRLISGT
ncbi:MAG TPA: N-methyl-L-tryptophan oxidase [Alphaproteobacteria bacterium]|nr:N-methyl-L-tryptophan oxidase [Alphaproteobacteria bacterium]